MDRPTLDPAIREVVRTVHRRLDGTGVEWALTGSASFALQGVPVEPNDVDVQTTERGAYAIEERFADSVVDPISRSESSAIRSHFGALELRGVRVEVMGDLRKRVDGRWEPPVDVVARRERVPLDDAEIPVLSLSYEARAYEQLGRTERAAVLREYVD
ncbi:nucleotidyltransferase domain-containing protein [Halovivax sp.]|uniref:nucleotidyltransferase domain-containing protein n=1 Tax=Halovivax sp. TaxID=1935978 RepID=UPI0025C06017|nr:hypothetical protein [Halovivax sp.]